MYNGCLGLIINCNNRFLHVFHRQPRYVVLYARLWAHRVNVGQTIKPSLYLATMKSNKRWRHSQWISFKSRYSLLFNAFLSPFRAIKSVMRICWKRFRYAGICDGLWALLYFRTLKSWKFIQSNFCLKELICKKGKLNWVITYSSSRLDAAKLLTTIWSAEKARTTQDGT